MAEIFFTASATRQWLGLSADVRKRIDAKLQNYTRTGQGDVKMLKGRAGGRLRVGDWRVIFIREGNKLVIAAVGHRREVYD